MLRTGKDYIESLRDGREVWIDGEQVEDVPTHPAFAPMVNVRARIYDLAHEAGTRDLLTYVDEESAERCATTSRPPRTRDDWRAKRASVDAILDEAGGVVTRVGDETVGEMWSLFDGQDVLNEIDPAFSANIAHHVRRAQLLDPFHVSANTDPKGNRSLRPQDQDPDVLLHVVGETDNGIVVRGRQVRDRGGLRQPGVRQTDHRRMEQRGPQRLRGRLPGRHGRSRYQAHLPVRLRGPARPG